MNESRQSYPFLVQTLPIDRPCIVRNRSCIMGDRKCIARDRSCIRSVRDVCQQ